MGTKPQTALKRARSSFCGRCCLKIPEFLPRASPPAGIPPVLLLLTPGTTRTPSRPCRLGKAIPRETRWANTSPARQHSACELCLCFVATPPSHHSLQSNCGRDGEMHWSQALSFIHSLKSVLVSLLKEPLFPPLLQAVSDIPKQGEAPSIPQAWSTHRVPAGGHPVLLCHCGATRPSPAHPTGERSPELSWVAV